MEGIETLYLHGILLVHLVSSISDHLFWKQKNVVKDVYISIHHALKIPINLKLEWDSKSNRSVYTLKLLRILRVGYKSIKWAVNMVGWVSTEGIHWAGIFKVVYFGLWLTSGDSNTVFNWYGQYLQMEG